MQPTNTNADIFSIIAARDAAQPVKAFKRVKRWQVCYSGRSSRKLYTYTAVRKLVSRAKRLGLDCYASPLMTNA